LAPPNPGGHLRRVGSVSSVRGAGRGSAVTSAWVAPGARCCMFWGQVPLTW